jgi:hypothetical protein
MLVFSSMTVVVLPSMIQITVKYPIGHSSTNDELLIKYWEKGRSIVSK